jgi:hypothetical protein
VGDAGGERSGPVGDWGAGSHRRGSVEGRGRGGTDPVGAKAGEECENIARVREGESFEGAVVVKGEAKKFG